MTISAAPGVIKNQGHNRTNRLALCHVEKFIIYSINSGEFSVEYYYAVLPDNRRIAQFLGTGYGNFPKRIFVDSIQRTIDSIPTILTYLPIERTSITTLSFIEMAFLYPQIIDIVIEV